jgi:hypothetical protein
MDNDDANNGDRPRLSLRAWIQGYTIIGIWALLLGKLLWFREVSGWVIGGAAVALFLLGVALEARK